MNMEEAMSLITAAKRIAPEVLAVREEAEQARRVPQPLSEIISGAGLYQMFLPASVGGAEAPPLVALQAIEELSKADGSVGWCTMIATDISLFTGWLDPKVVREMCGQPPCLRAAGSLRPMGRAYPVNGGYRVKGRWNFASGIDNANWLYCPCVIMVGEKPQLNAAGASVTRAMWLPSSAATIKDTWSVMGLRGTGSQDFEVNDLIVPENYTSSFTDPPYQKAPLYHPRMLFAFLFALNAGHALGIARGAMDGFVAIECLVGILGYPVRATDGSEEFSNAKASGSGQCRVGGYLYRSRRQYHGLWLCSPTTRAYGDAREHCHAGTTGRSDGLWHPRRL
jgi:alkylation response protein AidB-like acyl-CoA dehydrogenase